MIKILIDEAPSLVLDALARLSDLSPKVLWEAV